MTRRKPRNSSKGKFIVQIRFGPAERWRDWKPYPTLKGAKQAVVKLTNPNKLEQYRVKGY